MILVLIISLSFLAAPPDLVDMIEMQATLEYAHRYDVTERQIEIEVVRVTGKLEEQDLTIEWPDDAPVGTVQLRVTDQNGSRGWALMRIHHFASSAHAVRDISAGESISPSDLTFSMVNLISVRGEPLTRERLADYADDDGLIALRRIRAGAPLRTSDIGPAPIAEVGTSIVMDYQRGGVHLRITCKARESGATGDIIRLYAPDTRTTYRARLTGQGSAEWIETL